MLRYATVSAPRVIGVIAAGGSGLAALPLRPSVLDSCAAEGLSSRACIIAQHVFLGYSKIASACAFAGARATGSIGNPVFGDNFSSRCYAAVGERLLRFGML